MAGDVQTSFAGNLTADPVIRETDKGLSVASFTVAVTPRTFDRETSAFVDGDTTFLRCTAWRGLASNIGATLVKGSRVVVVGKLVQNNYEKDGKTVYGFELQVDDLGASLTFDSYTRVAKG